MHCVSCIAHFHSDKVSKEIGPTILPKRNENMGQEAKSMEDHGPWGMLLFMNYMNRDGLFKCLSN